MINLNKIDKDAFIQEIKKCCVSEKWAAEMEKARPFNTIQELKSKASEIWFHNCSQKDWLQAFEGHPQIGNIESLKKKYGTTKKWSSHEQSGMDLADEKIIQELSNLNQKYLEKFGHIFIVCATGKTAEQMLNLIQKRILNSSEQEIQNAIIEQDKITLLRIDKLEVQL